MHLFGLVTSNPVKRRRPRSQTVKSAQIATYTYHVSVTNPSPASLSLLLIYSHFFSLSSVPLLPLFTISSPSSPYTYPSVSCSLPPILLCCPFPPPNCLHMISPYFPFDTRHILTVPSLPPPLPPSLSTHVSCTASFRWKTSGCLSESFCCSAWCVA